MVHGTPNKEWTKKIRNIGLKRGAKIQNGDPFKGVLMSGSTSKGTNAERQRSVRNDSFGYEPDEWDVCLEMVRLRGEMHWTYGQIANWLNTKDIKTKANREWNYFTTRFVVLRTVQILKNQGTFDEHAYGIGHQSSN